MKFLTDQAGFFPWTNFLFDDSDGSGSGSAGGTPPSGSGDGTGSGNSDGTGTGKPDGDKTFTQDEVNSLVAREVAKAQRGKLDPKELGFDSQKELKEFIDSMKQKADADKTEAERKLEQAIKDAEDRAKEGILQVSNDRVIRSEFRLQARENGVSMEALNDALVLAQADEDLWKTVTINDEGVVSGLDEQFFKDLKEKKPYLFAESNDDGGQGGAGGSGNGSGQGKPGDIGAGAGGGKPPAQDQAEMLEHFPAMSRVVLPTNK